MFGVRQLTSAGTNHDSRYWYKDASVLVGTTRDKRYVMIFHLSLQKGLSVACYRKKSNYIIFKPKA